MTRLIDADALINTLGVSDEDIDFREILGDAPTIEIVLCMDCKRQKTCKFAQWQGNYGYCSNGEKGGE